MMRKGNLDRTAVPTRRGVPARALVLLALFWLSPYAAQTGGAASFTWVEMWRHTPAAPVHETALGAVAGPLPSLLARTGERVNVYGLAADGPRFIASVDDLPERPTALAVADYDGDGADDLWVGTESPGLIYVFTYDEETGGFARRERVGYAWDDIVRILPFNLDGEGAIDVAALNREGALAIFRSTPAGYERVAAAGVERQVRFVEAGDFDRDGRDELAVALDEDRVVLLGWLPEDEEEHEHDAGGDSGSGFGRGELVLEWENYVWGAHAGLLVGDFSGRGMQEVAILSARRVLTRFARDERGRIQLAGPPVDWPGPIDALMGLLDLDLDGRTEALEKTGEGVRAWGIGSAVTEDQALAASSVPVDRAHLTQDGKGLVLSGPWGFAYLEARDSNHVRIVARGAEFALLEPPLWDEGEVYLAAEDWLRLFGVRFRWDDESGKIVGIRGFHVIAGEVGGESWVVDGRPIGPLPPAKAADGLLYVPIAFARAIGIELEWEPYSRTLVVK